MKTKIFILFVFILNLAVFCTSAPKVDEEQIANTNTLDRENNPPDNFALNELNSAVERAKTAQKQAIDLNSQFLFPMDWQIINTHFLVTEQQVMTSTMRETQETTARYYAMAAAFEALNIKTHIVQENFIQNNEQNVAWNTGSRFAAENQPFTQTTASYTTPEYIEAQANEIVTVALEIEETAVDRERAPAQQAVPAARSIDRMAAANRIRHETPEHVRQTEAAITASQNSQAAAPQPATLAPQPTPTPQPVTQQTATEVASTEVATTSQSMQPTPQVVSTSNITNGVVSTGTASTTVVSTPVAHISELPAADTAPVRQPTLTPTPIPVQSELLSDSQDSEVSQNAGVSSANAENSLTSQSGKQKRFNLLFIILAISVVAISVIITKHRKKLTLLFKRFNKTI